MNAKTGTMMCSINVFVMYVFYVFGLVGGCTIFNLKYPAGLVEIDPTNKKAIPPCLNLNA